MRPAEATTCHKPPTRPTLRPHPPRSADSGGFSAACPPFSSGGGCSSSPPGVTGRGAVREGASRRGLFAPGLDLPGGGTAGRSAVSGEACGRVVSALLRRNASARGPCPSSSSYAPVVVRPRPRRRLCEEERVFAQLALPDARRPRLWEVAQPLPTQRRHLRRLDARMVEQMDGCDGAPVAFDGGGGGDGAQAARSAPPPSGRRCWAGSRTPPRSAPPTRGSCWPRARRAAPR